MVIDAPLSEGGWAGGGQQFLMGLIRALDNLDTGQEFTIAVPHRATTMVRELDLERVRVAIRPPAESPMARMVPRVFRPALARTRDRFFSAVKSSSVPDDEVFLEALAPDVIHFPVQGFARVQCPTAYNPHDLQHVHYPEFFSPRELERRRVVFRAGCQEADAVVVLSEWVKQDVSAQYGVDLGKIHVIRHASPTEHYESSSSVDEAGLSLPERFALFPAQTWPHKNHLRLLEALSILKRKGVTVPLICTGEKNDHYRQIERVVRELDLDGQVSFLGFVPGSVMLELYRSARLLVFPSLFEGAGLPILEAMREGLPIACSNATSLPEYGGAAAVYFDPMSVEDIAEAVSRLWADEDLRALLVAKGTDRADDFSWEKVAVAYSEVYASIGGGT